MRAREEIIFATIIRKQISSDREGGAGPRRAATNGGPHPWRIVAAGNSKRRRARRVLETRNKKKRMDGEVRFDEHGKKEGCNTRTSQEVTHPSTTLAQARLTAEF